jgi:hypothetical protein
MAEPELVPTITQITHRPSKRATSTTQVAETVHHNLVCLKPQLQATQVETSRQGLRNQGCSAAKPDRIAKRKKAIYNTKWNKLSEWCGNIQEDPVQATPQLVASLLEYLFDDSS